jgi:hypothetical protein
MGDGGLAPIIINLSTRWSGEDHRSAEFCPGMIPVTYRIGRGRGVSAAPVWEIRKK